MDTITDFRKLLSANSTDTTFATRGTLLAAPTTVNRPGLIATSDFCNDGQAPRAFQFVPFGLGVDGATLEIMVNHLGRVKSTVNADEWVEPTLGYLTCTKGTLVGSSVAGAAASTTNRFCDTVALTKGNSATVIVDSPENNVMGSFTVDARASKYLEVIFKSTTSADGNVLFRPLYEP